MSGRTFPSRGASIALLVLCGALPGEMYSCTTDLSDEIDPSLYCTNRCRVLCERLITCGLARPSSSSPAGEADDHAPLEVCQTNCEEQYQCVSPWLCISPDAYISINEAETCLDQWAGVSCGAFENVPSCGLDFAACPRPYSCRSEELCDPPDWE